MRSPSNGTDRPRGPMAEMLAGCVADLGQSEGYILAADCLRSTHSDPARARDAFLRTLREERAGRVLINMFGTEVVEARALDFISSVAADMHGDALNASPGGQSQVASTKAHYGAPLGDATHAPAGHPCGASLEAEHQSPAGAPQAGMEGHFGPASTEATIPMPSIPAPPSPQARAAARAALTAVSDNLLDTYLIDGVPIGDLRMDQVRRLAKIKREQAEVLAAIAAHAGGAAGHMRVREVYTNMRLTRELARAERKSNAIAC